MKNTILSTLLLISACGAPAFEAAEAKIALATADGEQFQQQYNGPRANALAFRDAVLSLADDLRGDDGGFLELTIGEDGGVRRTLATRELGTQELADALSQIALRHGFRLGRAQSESGEASVSSAMMRGGAGGTDGCGCVMCKPGVLASWCLFESRCEGRGRVCSYTDCGNACGTWSPSSY